MKLALSRAWFLVAALAFAIGVCPASAQQLWFVPQGGIPPSPPPPAADFMELFKPDAPWQMGAGHLEVFGLYPAFVFGAPQDQINIIVADLNRRHISIALEVGMIDVGRKADNPSCGGWGLVEGYGTTAQAKKISDKILKAGGVLDYIAMDEPLWYGHYFKGYPGRQPGCQARIDEVIQQMAAPLAVYRQAFPKVAIGDIEPSLVAEQRGWQDDLAEWSRVFQASTGKPLAFLQLDIPWAHPHEDKAAFDLYGFAQTLKKQELIGKLGIIYDASVTSTSDHSWVREAEKHIHTIQTVHGIVPDQAIIQSWQVHPTHVLPETAPDTLTGLLSYYIRSIGKN
jgi:hypothetical protein